MGVGKVWVQGSEVMGKREERSVEEEEIIRKEEDCREYRRKEETD